MLQTTRQTASLQTTIPTLQSKRFSLRPINVTDREFYIALHQNPITCQYVEGPLTREHANKDFEFSLRLNKIGSMLTFMIMAKADVADHTSNTSNVDTTAHYQQQTPLGFCALLWNKYRSSIEMGIYLHSDYFAQGIAKETLNTLLDYAFNVVNIDTIMMRTHFNNIAMIKTINSLDHPITRTRNRLQWHITKNNNQTTGD